MNETKIKTTSKDFFLNIGAIVALYLSVISILGLIFAIINNYLPDALDGRYGIYRGGMDAMRWSISCLIIVFPLYIYLSHIINKDIALQPEKRNIGIRKVFSYLTLFLTGATIATDLVLLINKFLQGEISSRFIFKVLAVLIVALAVFSYYMYDLKKEDVADVKKARTFAWIAGLFVLICIIVGFISVGSPFTERQRKMDDRRVQDLSSIQSQIVFQYWQKTGKLPENLEALNDPIAAFSAPRDPETGLPYEYKVTGANSFELCATFNLPLSEGSPGLNRPYSQDGLGTFDHGVGRTCFSRTIDPRLYPVQTETPQGIMVPPAKNAPIMTTPERR